MIKFTVTGQRLTAVTPIIVAGTYNYLTAEFAFSADWTAAKKIAHFELGDELHDIELHDDKIVEADGLDLPAGDWHVSVTGWIIDDGAVSKQITTSSCIVRVVGKSPGFAPIAPSLAERITAEAIAARTGAETAQRAAETARDDARGYVEQAKAETAEMVRQAQEAVSETIVTDLTTAETELALSKDVALGDISATASIQRENIAAEGIRQIAAVESAGKAAAEKSENAAKKAEAAQAAAESAKVDAETAAEKAAGKLDAPANPVAGKVLKVLNVNEDGTFTCEWADAGSGGGAVNDVQVNGTSITVDGVANIPISVGETYGVVRTSTTQGVYSNKGVLQIVSPTDDQIERRASPYKPIVAPQIDKVVKTAMCYGIGAWTAEEQAAAQERIGILSVEEVLF